MNGGAALGGVALALHGGRGRRGAWSLTWPHQWCSLGLGAGEVGLVDASLGVAVVHAGDESIKDCETEIDVND